MRQDVRDRLERLKETPAWFGIAVAVCGVVWWLIDAWGNVEFISQKVSAFWNSPVGIVLRSYVVRPEALFIAGISWLSYLVVRPSSTEPRLYTVRRLLREAEAEFREAATKPRARNIAEAGEGAHTMLSVMKFLQQAFTHRIHDDFTKYLNVEGDKWRDAGVTHNADDTIARYLKRLAREIREDDLDQGFPLPTRYVEYRAADKWPANRRPIPTDTRR